MSGTTIIARTADYLERRPVSADLTEPDVLDEDLAIVCALLEAELRDDDGRAPERVAMLVEELARATALRARLRAHVGGLGAGIAPRIHDALGRLRASPTVAALLPAAAAELGACCGFDRTVVSRLRGSAWRAEAVWVAPGLDPAVTTATVDYLTHDWIGLGPGVLETEIVQRRVACLVDPEDPRTNKDLVAASQTRGYVVAPVVAADRVVGFLQADCFGDGRRLGPLDRDNLRAFADGFGFVLERVARLERLVQRRRRLDRAVDAASRSLSTLSRDEASLARGRHVPVPEATMAVRASPTRIEQLLTAREREVADLLVTGARNAQIAERLVISEDTVKSHVRTVARKLEASSRADAVARYLRHVLREAP
ncbi:LuxR C-terminal-related transcriptional regulator [Patulibacter sp. NPDC049589]|uniref:LuxR C-terminal-related transcriptional regulator n=1 Tax=Patulibacter sp. NPDC049589 TaxID=3154731 RepID=UPI00343ED749